MFECIGKTVAGQEEKAVREDEISPCCLEKEVGEDNNELVTAFDFALTPSTELNMALSMGPLLPLSWAMVR